MIVKIIAIEKAKERLAGSHLVSISVSLPIGDTILLCHVFALWHHLRVLDVLRGLVAFRHEVFPCDHIKRLVRRRQHPHLTLGVGHDLALDLGHIGTNLSDGGDVGGVVFSNHLPVNHVIL